MSGSKEIRLQKLKINENFLGFAKSRQKLPAKFLIPELRHKCTNYAACLKIAHRRFGFDYEGTLYKRKLQKQANNLVIYNLYRFGVWQQKPIEPKEEGLK